MAFSVTFPIRRHYPIEYCRLRENIPVCAPRDNNATPQNYSLRIASFTYNDSTFCLAKDLASIWNYPSSYQVITRLTRKSGLRKQKLYSVSDEKLNNMLLKHGLISSQEIRTALFYIDVNILSSILPKISSLYIANEEELQRIPSTIPLTPDIEDELITISQVFTNYGTVDQTLPLTPASFLALTPITKLHVYKHEGNYRKVYGTSLSAHERELLTLACDYTASSGVSVKSSIDSEKSKKRTLSRSKKFVGNVDPNQLDVAENLLPGCGYIPEFNVNAICKVPNYFVTSKEMGAQQATFQNQPRPHLGEFDILGKKVSNMPKQLYQLLSNTDQEAYHLKYYYYKSYRGPGSGNYKDASLVNKINKIRRFTKDTAPTNNHSTHLSAGKVTKPAIRKGDAPIKGLMHEHFSTENVEIVVERQRRFVEDFENLEMLHNNMLFNLMVNAYRDVAGDTWKAFYKFRMTDFEKDFHRNQKEKMAKKKVELYANEHQQGVSKSLLRSRELAELQKWDLSSRFSLPSDYPEILEKLPYSLRENDDDPDSALSEPVRYIARYPDKNTPSILNQIEVIKLPNANSIGWDNIKKYRRG